MSLNQRLDKDKLRQLTRQAVETAVRQTENSANSIFSSGMQSLKAELIAGRSSAIIMTLKRGTDFESGDGSESKPLKPESLTGVAARVFERAKPFRPSLDYWSKQEGQWDPYTVEGFNIVAHWSSMDELLQQVSQLSDPQFKTMLTASSEEIETALTDKVAQIIGQISRRAEAQANAGRDWASIMTLKEGVDFERPSSARAPKVCKPEWLGAVARAVWDACADFAPTIEYWSKPHSDCRNETWEETGFDIVIHWGHVA